MRTMLVLLLLVSTFTGKAQKTASTDPKLLVGKWRSEEDKLYKVIFTADTETEYYDKEMQGTLTYTLKGNELTSKDKKSGEVFHYSVVRLTPRNLILMYRDRGNTLKFIRESTGNK